MAALQAFEARQRWYVVHTLPHREFYAQRNLEQQGFEVFLPTEWKTTRHARRFLTVKAALFSRYLFVRLDLERNRWRSVSGTFGVAAMIMEGERPKPVPVGLVEQLLGLRDAGGTLSFESLLKPGQSVRLISGPFAGTIGTLNRLTSAERVEVFLNLMGGEVLLSMRRNTLAPAA